MKKTSPLMVSHLSKTKSRHEAYKNNLRVITSCNCKRQTISREIWLQNDDLKRGSEGKGEDYKKQ